jgi:hypothetical protein
MTQGKKGYAVWWNLISLRISFQVQMRGVLHKTLSHSMQIKKKLIDKNAIKVIKHKIAYPSLRFYPQSMPPPLPPLPPLPR